MVRWLTPYAGRPRGAKAFCFLFWVLGGIESSRAYYGSNQIYWLQDFKFQLRKVEFIFFFFTAQHPLRMAAWCEGSGSEVQVLDVIISLLKVEFFFWLLSRIESGRAHYGSA